MSVVNELWLYDAIETKIKDLINDWDTVANVKSDITTYTNYLIDFDGDNIVWKENPTIEELEQAKKDLEELEKYYEALIIYLTKMREI